jgi:hypothetical protein
MNPQSYDTAEDKVLEKQMHERAGVVGNNKIASPRNNIEDYKANSGEKRNNQYPS